MAVVAGWERQSHGAVSEDDVADFRQLQMPEGSVSPVLHGEHQSEILHHGRPDLGQVSLAFVRQPLFVLCAI